jgi:DNA-directed RNA polymerase specialized sigma24 family protein
MAEEASSKETRYSEEEVRAALAALTEDDMRRLKVIARHFAPRSGLPNDDLLQEAFLRVLGSRTCKVGVGVVGFVAGTIRSIASESPRARKKAKENLGLEIVYVSQHGGAGVPEPATDAVSPEEEALARVMYCKEIERVAELLKGDEELQLLVEGLIDGSRGKDLEELLSTDTKGLAAAKKRLFRKVELAFPDGVPL